jgi:DNA-binding transcriptional regulator GbsR (MarR family)
MGGAQYSPGHTVRAMSAENNMEEGADKMTNSISGLSPVESEVIQLFVQFSRAVGQPRSIAEIYGLLFVSHRSLTLDDLVERLQLSKGSASQGLKYLRELGAVRAVAVANARRVHYEAVAELRNMAGSFLHQQVSTHLSDSSARLERISAHAQTLTGEARKHALNRVKLLQSWEKNGRRILPFLLKMLGK